MGRTVGNKVVIYLNACALATSAYAFWWTFTKLTLPLHLAGGGHWQFLTNLSLLFADIVFALGIAAHLLRLPVLFQLRNSFHPVALTLEMVVTAVYWPLRLFFILKLTKLPREKYVPLVVDMFLHLVPVVALLVDYIFFMPPYEVTTEAAFGFCILLTTLYWFLLKVLIDFEQGGEYPYMFLNVDTELQRVGIFGIVGLIGFAMFVIVRRIHNVFVGKDKEE